MIALGLANFFGSFFKSIPTCGAFTRSAVSNASGVASPLSGIYSAVMALLALTLLTPYFNYIPKTTLAAILICAVLSLVSLSSTSRQFAALITFWENVRRLISPLPSTCGEQTKSILSHGSDASSFVSALALKSACCSASH